MVDYQFSKDEIEKLLKKHIILQKILKEQPAVKNALNKLDAVVKLCYYDGK
jgi:hypothetical protein